LELQSPGLSSTSSFSSWKKSSALRYSTVPGLTGTQPLPAKSISTQQKSGIIYETLASEEMVLAVPTKLVTALDMKNGDLALLREEPFVLTQKTSTIREIVDSVFKNAGFTPNVLFETSNNHAIISMIHENICCGILPMYYMDPEDEAITYFQLPDHPSWEIVAAYRKGHYISKPARTLIELAGNYFTQ